jgi:WD40 repeat protein
MAKCHFLVCMALLVPCRALAQSSAPLPDLPAPTRTLENDKQFNAVTIGPGNTFSIREAPPDFRLDSFDLGPDGKYVFMGWASGRLEVWDSHTGKRVAQFKPMPGPVFEAYYREQSNQLLVTSQHGLIRFVDPHSGKMLREIRTEPGEHKYDLQKLLVARDGNWLAYVNQENGKVLDLKSDPPRILADLGDAYDLALTPDQSEIWLVNREKISGIRTESWKLVGSTSLLDKVQPTQTPSIAVVATADGPVAFVPSQGGLLRYDLKTLTGQKASPTPTYWVAARAVSNDVIVNELHALAFYTPNGSLLCQFKQPQHRELKVSENGEWLGILIFDKVELRSLDSLAASCDKSKP